MVILQLKIQYLDQEHKDLADETQNEVSINELKISQWKRLKLNTERSKGRLKKQKRAKENLKIFQNF